MAAIPPVTTPTATAPLATVLPDKPENKAADYKTSELMAYFRLNDTLKHKEEKATMECAYSLLLTCVATIGAITPLACLSGTVAISVAIPLGILAAGFAAITYKHLCLAITAKEHGLTSKIIYKAMKKDSLFTNREKIEIDCNKIIGELDDLTKKFLQDYKAETKPATTTPPDKTDDNTIDYKTAKFMAYFWVNDTFKHREEQATMECAYSLLLTCAATIGAITPLACLSGTVAICVAIPLGILATAFAAITYKHLCLAITAINDL